MPSFEADQQFPTSVSQILRGSPERGLGDLY